MFVSVLTLPCLSLTKDVQVINMLVHQTEPLLLVLLNMFLLSDAAVIQANWDASRVREKLQRDMDAHASSVCSAKLSELNVNYEVMLR